jgi:hypothetical protein
MNRDCEWKEISKTRNRPRTGARVAELEHRLQEMSATMQALTTQFDKSESSTRITLLSPPLESTPSQAFTTGITLQQPSIARPDQTAWPCSRSDLVGLPKSSSLSYPVHASQPREDLPMFWFTEDRRCALLESYVKTFHPLYPILGCASLSPLEMQTLRPFTANAMMTAGCILEEPTMFVSIHSATARMTVESAVIHGEKSLDLAQALLIVATWADTPADISRSCLYQWTLMAYSMVVELGMIVRSSQRERIHQLSQRSQEIANGDKEGLCAVLAVLLCCSRFADDSDHKICC